jgi:hypothetical protein
VGEFNKGQIHATAMKKAADGSFKVALDLKPGRECQGVAGKSKKMRLLN